MKYGVCVRITEEKLSQFINQEILNPLYMAQLCDVIKKIVLTNWHLTTVEDAINCKGIYDFTTETYIFKFKSEFKVPCKHFVFITEGNEFPQYKSLL